MTDLDATLNKLANMLGPIVKHIEAKPPTTENHYGDYMSALAVIAKRVSDKPASNVYLGIGVALQRAGANKQGVQAALRIMGHI